MSELTRLSEDSANIFTLEGFNEDLMGWNVIDQKGFDMLLYLRKSDIRWNMREEEQIIMMMRDGFGATLSPFFAGSPAYDHFIRACYNHYMVEVASPMTFRNYKSQFIMKKFNRPKMTISEYREKLATGELSDLKI